MRCLLCDKEMLDSSIFDMLSDDKICQHCRCAWEKKEIKFRYEGIKLRSTYLYNDAFSKALLQYKECYDEALKDIFLYGLIQKLRFLYRGYTLVLMPSSMNKENKRGFSHLKEIFSLLNMDMIEPFIKTEDISQKGLTADKRMRIKGKIILKDNVILPKKLLLVDDVITSGATLSTAIKCLEGMGKDMQIYTLSYTKMWR